jgi:hypothetical protein
MWLLLPLFIIPGSAFVGINPSSTRTWKRASPNQVFVAPPSARTSESRQKSNLSPSESPSLFRIDHKSDSRQILDRIRADINLGNIVQVLDTIKNECSQLNNKELNSIATKVISVLGAADYVNECQDVLDLVHSLNEEGPDCRTYTAMMSVYNRKQLFEEVKHS